MLQSRLIAKRPSFSSVDEHIAQIILSMPYDANLTSTSLALKCDVSQSTIVRFAQKLGYPSFREFLSDYVAFKLAQPTPVNSSSHLKTSLAQENIDYMDAHAHTPDFQNALKLLSEAQKVFVVGDDASFECAKLIADTLVEYLKDVQIVSHHQLMKLVECSEDDIVLFIEANESTSLLEAVLLSKHAQVKTILLTQKINSMLHDYIQLELHTLPTQKDSSSSRLELMFGCLQFALHWIAYFEANYPNLLEQRSAFKQRIKAIAALAKHKGLQ
jgi:DNA-binding MurR/RpiR family transcriptional regulator